ncbi:MAG: GNAT family N-acetyltransferase [Bacteroidota bacterium]
MLRPALPSDAPHLARLTILAMGNLADKFVNNPSDKVSLFEHFARLKNNQYSYENMLIWDEGGIMGMINCYNGADLQALRAPFLEYINSSYNVFVQPEDETQTGEYYIDCLAVYPEHQGRGIGKKLITGLANCARAKDYNKLGLLVKKDNAAALRLYISLNFKVVDDRIFMGDDYHHLQLDLETNTD